MMHFSRKNEAPQPLTMLPSLSALLVAFIVSGFVPAFAQTSLPAGLSANVLQQFYKQKGAFSLSDLGGMKQDQGGMKQDQGVSGQNQGRLTQPRRAPEAKSGAPGFETVPELQPFGFNLMNSEAVHSDVLDIPVPADYGVGPGDIIDLQLFGKENLRYSLPVSREGDISLPDIGPQSVAGMSFETVRNVILQRIARQKIGVEASVSMGRLRSIQVFLAGDVNYPGLFTTSALSTTTNALLNAGGVGPTGSLRRIQLRRNGRTIAHLDLYDLLLRGDNSKDARLQPGDVIFVPPVGQRIALDTGVNRPAIYELLHEKTLGEVIAMAGGLLPTAFAAEGRVERIKPDGSRDVIGVNLADNTDSQSPVHDGDIVSFGLTLQRNDSSVTLLGAAARSGEHPWRPGMTLADLLTSSDKLQHDAWGLLGFIARIEPLSGALFYLPFNPGAVIAGDAPPLALHENDEIIIIGPREVGYLTSANVQFVLAGLLPPESPTNGSEQLLAVDNRQLQRARDELTQTGSPEALDSAAGMLPEAIDNGADMLPEANSGSVEEADPRKMKKDSSSNPRDCLGLVALAEIVHQEGPSRFRSAALGASSENSDSRLLNVQSCPQLFNLHPRLLPAVLEHTITVRGEVRSPGLLPVAPGVSLEKTIRAAGGMTREADSDHIELLRQQTLPDGRIDVNRKVLSRADLSAETTHSGDMIITPKRFSMQDNGSVRVSGEVYRPGIYDIRRGERLSSVLERAGGLTQNAYPFGAVFQRTRVKEAKRIYYQRAGLELQGAALMALTNQRRSGGGDSSIFAAMRSLSDQIKQIEPSGRIVVEADPTVLQVRPELDVVLEPGDEILIPKRPSHVLVMGEVQNPGAVQFRSGLKAADYMHAAGGATETADDERTYLILPDGSAEPVAIASWNEQPTPVPPGSVIYVPRDPLPFNSTTVLLTTLEIVKDVALTAASINSISK